MNEFDKEVCSVRQSVADLYETGAVKPGRPAGTPGAAPRSPGPGAALKVSASRGTTAALLAASACPAGDYRRAVEAGDRAVLAGLAGKTVVLKGMLLERAKEEKERLLVRLHAGGGEVGAEFPATCEVIGVRPGKSLVVSGVPREAGGGWVLRVTQWGATSDLDRGKPMSTCEWPASGDAR